jgi:hypothetical protein
MLLDGTIVAAQNNETFGISMGLGQITKGLAAMSAPSYFLFDAPLANNGTTLADTSIKEQPAQTSEQQQQQQQHHHDRLPTTNLT